MRQKLKNNDVVNHPRFGEIIIKMQHRETYIPSDIWFAEQNNKPITPTFYTERKLHFYLRWYSYTKPYYTILKKEI